MAEQPKRAASSYFLWLQDNRAALQKELGTAKGSAVSKLAGERWKKLTAEQKAPYEAKAKEAKAAFEKAIESFKAEGGVVEKRKRKGDKPAKAKKDPNAPKKPVGGGYGVFLAKNREEIAKSLPKDHKMTDVGKAAGERWKALTEAEKKPFVDEYATNVEAYKKALAEWKAADKGDDAEDDAGEEGEEEGDEGGDEAAEEGDEEKDEEPVAKRAAKRARKAGA